MEGVFLHGPRPFTRLLTQRPSVPWFTRARIIQPSGMSTLAYSAKKAKRGYQLGEGAAAESTCMGETSRRTCCLPHTRTRARVSVSISTSVAIPGEPKPKAGRTGETRSNCLLLFSVDDPTDRSVERDCAHERAANRWYLVECMHTQMIKRCLCSGFFSVWFIGMCCRSAPLPLKLPAFVSNCPCVGPRRPCPSLTVCPFPDPPFFFPCPPLRSLVPRFAPLPASPPCRGLGNLAQARGMETL